MEELTQLHSLVRFERNGSVSRGFKAGFMTPTLYALGSEFRITNNETIDTVNLLLCDQTVGRDLTNNRQRVDKSDLAIEDLAIPLFQDNTRRTTRNVPYKCS